MLNALILQIGGSVRIDPWILSQQRGYTGILVYLKYSRELHPTKVIMDGSESTPGSMNTVELIIHSRDLGSLY